MKESRPPIARRVVVKRRRRGIRGVYRWECHLATCAGVADNNNNNNNNNNNGNNGNGNNGNRFDAEDAEDAEAQRTTERLRLFAQRAGIFLLKAAREASAWLHGGVLARG
jgi:hypothetical protein